MTRALALIAGAAPVTPLELAFGTGVWVGRHATTRAPIALPLPSRA